jgi:hypothetical protein
MTAKANPWTNILEIPPRVRPRMRSLLAALVILLAGCSAAPAPTEERHEDPEPTWTFDERDLLDTPFEARNGQGGNASFVVPEGARDVKLRVILQDTVGTRLTFRGPGECAEFTPVEGQLAVHLATGRAMEAECGAVAAGEHDLQWEADGFARGHVYVRAVVPVSA